jgi:hypothetical protein
MKFVYEFFVFYLANYIEAQPSFLSLPWLSPCPPLLSTALTPKATDLGYELLPS